MIKRVAGKVSRLKRARRVRARMTGTAERPRLTVHRSSIHMYAQVIDDRAGRTVAAASSLDADLKPHLAGLKKTQRAEKVGDAIARRAVEAGITSVVFDRSGFKYHGRVQALADAARAAGLKF